MGEHAPRAPCLDSALQFDDPRRQASVLSRLALRRFVPARDLRLRSPLSAHQELHGERPQVVDPAIQVRVDQQSEHHLGVVGRAARPVVSVAGVECRHVHHGHDVEHEPDQVVLRQPVGDARREKEELVPARCLIVVSHETYGTTWHNPEHAIQVYLAPSIITQTRPPEPSLAPVRPFRYSLQEPVNPGPGPVRVTRTLQTARSCSYRKGDAALPVHIRVRRAGKGPAQTPEASSISAGTSRTGSITFDLQERAS